MRPAFLFSLAFLAACDGNGGNDDTNNDDTSGDDTSDDTGGDDTSGDDTGGDSDFNNNYTGPDNGPEVPSRAADEVIFGNLSDGSVPSSVGWMDDSPYYCGAALGNTFSGAHTHHTYAEGQATDLYIRLTPDQGTDMSVYAMQRAEGSTELPPTATPAGGGDCDAGYDSDGNPSQPETTCVYSTAGYDYSVLIGVAGVGNLTSGPYKLEIWENDMSGGGGGCIHPNGL